MFKCFLAFFSASRPLTEQPGRRLYSRRCANISSCSSSAFASTSCTRTSSRSSSAFSSRAHAGRMVSPLNPPIDTHARNTVLALRLEHPVVIGGGTLGRHLATEAGVTNEVAVGDELVGLDSSTALQA